MLGVVLFLASELMFFAALFASYYDLRVTAAVWPSPGVDLNQLEGGIGTLLLLLSSVFTALASRAAARQRSAAGRRWLLAAAVAAVCFIALSLHGYSEDRFGIASSAYGSIYYTLTGFHLLHVLVGVGMLAAMAAGIRSAALTANQRAGFEAMSYYWHFVFIVWAIGIYPTVYFVK